jgi:hypothetical protein|tara:strand:+ start:7851 stop:8120 length:270 start_codon:yes stop_codon:yes gene_type:complete
MPNIYDEQSFGAAGSQTLTSAQGSTTIDACAIQCIGDTVFATLTDGLEASGGAASTSLTYTDGIVLFGKFSTVSVTSGAARCYLSSPLS